MTALALLPAWVPADRLLVALVITLLAIRFMNRGLPWFINVKAQDEPLAVGIGAGLILLAGWFSTQPVLEMVPAMFWFAAGTLAAFIGIAARYTDHIDISGLI